MINGWIYDITIALRSIGVGINITIALRSIGVGINIICCQPKIDFLYVHYYHEHTIQQH